MALYFVVECDMTRYSVVWCVVAGHDIHDMAWRVVVRGVEFYTAWTQPNRLRAWTQPKTYAWRLRSRTQSKSGFESNSETTAELGIEFEDEPADGLRVGVSQGCEDELCRG